MDVQSFKQRFLPYHAKLYRIAYRFVGCGDDAEDMLQNLYMKLWQKKDELEGVENDEAFCVTLLKNICLDFLKQARNRYEGDEDPPDVPDETANEVEQCDELRQVTQLIGQLPEQQQTVIKLRMRDCEMEDIERITGLSSANVRTTLSRARKKLKELYDNLCLGK